jgi:hypothetical protein
LIRLATSNPKIGDEIFKNFAITATGHSDGSWFYLLAYYREIAKNSVLDRFLCVYYMPDYLPQLLFVSGVAKIIASLRFN